jgi:hypothetical protein
MRKYFFGLVFIVVLCGFAAAQTEYDKGEVLSGIRAMSMWTIPAR